MKKLLFFASAIALLASCSKDLTEDLAPAKVSGKSTVFATYDSGDDATRTVATPNNTSYKFTWEDGDALGVFNAVEKDEANAVFSYKGATSTDAGEFAGDLEFLADGNYVGYYPYADGRAIDENGNITLSISKKQNYRFNAPDTNAGSFAKNVAPAVAYGKATEDNKLDLTFYPVAAYVCVPIQGFGTIKSLDLEIENAKLTGTFTTTIESVAAATEAKEIEFDYSGLDANDRITLNCGSGVMLDPETPTYFWFVVPAGVEIKNISLYVNEEDEASLTRKIEAGYTTKINTPVVLGQDTNVAFNWVEGDAYIISNNIEFLMYAYAATNGVETDTPARMKAEDGTLRPAVIVKDIEFDGNDVNEWVTNAEDAAFMKTVLNAYNADHSIPTIGKDDVEFKISGNVNKEAATITGLTVKGTAMFHDGEAGKKKNVVENMTFVGCTVDATGLKSDAFFLANRVNNYTTFEGVTVGEGCDVLIDADNGKTPAVACKKAVVGKAYSNNLSEIENATELTDANRLYLLDQSNASPKVVSLEDCEITYNLLTVHNVSEGLIINVAAEDVEATMAKFDQTDSNAAKWYSVVSGYKAATAKTKASIDCSYWTGLIATEVNDDVFFTAEELAKAVQAGSDTYTFTNNIDLMGGVELNEGLTSGNSTGFNWGAVLPTAETTGLTLKVADDDEFTVSNIYVEPAKAAAATSTTPEVKAAHAVSVFGPYTSVLGALTVKDAYVTDKTVGKTTMGISGLTMVGGFDGVTVENMLISAYENTTVGGIVRSIRHGNSVKNVTFKGRIAQHTNKLTRGTIAGEFVPYDPATAFEFTGLSATCVGTPATLPVFGLVSVGKPATAGTDYDVEISFYNFKAILPENIVVKASDTEDYVVRVTSFPTEERKNGTTNDITVKVEKEE